MCVIEHNLAACFMAHKEYSLTPIRHLIAKWKVRPVK